MHISHPDKIWFPKSKITKQAIVSYYEKISKYCIPHVKNHLIVLQRFPNGIDQPSFYQKQISDYFPKFIKRKTIALKKGDSQTLVMINTKKSLIYLANQGTIVFHSWLSNITAINKPDKIVFDFDPATNNLKSLRFAVKEMKKILERHKLVPFLMTTGSRGYHVVVPIKPEHSFPAVHDFAKKIAQQLVEQFPTTLTITPMLSKRSGKIFIDYLRNSYGQTSVAPYAVRAIEKAPIATPILWSELNLTKPQKYTIKNIFTRLTSHGDAWKNFKKSSRRLKI